mgnify:CR=1 FL=1
MSNLPSTEVHLRVLNQSFLEKSLTGEIYAGGFEWQFTWKFGRSELKIEPSLGRALIQDALMKFLIKTDYHLESGGDYNFTVRAQF